MQNVNKEQVQFFCEDFTQFSPSLKTRERHSGLHSHAKNITYI